MFGLVGESDCGKTTLRRAVLRLLPITSGHIFFDTPAEVKAEIARLKENKSPRLRELLKEYDLAFYSGERLKGIRRRMQLVQQDPHHLSQPQDDS